MKGNFIDELTWRGMLHDSTPNLRDILSGGMTTGYIGFDPTADSLHIGHLVQIMTLVHFQRAGHKPIALVGGGTGMVGDPSGKSQERNLLSLEVVKYNQQCIYAQLNRFLNFDCGKNSAEMANNYAWLADFSFLDFIRDVGKHISISYMLSKDSVQKRLETGLSFAEFTYQLVQAYDFYWLYEHKKCKLQMGGSDQWGNIVTGIELIRRKLGGEAQALTTSLITKADGTKFGKTEEGSLWLDAKKTSPYQFYQYWINLSDVDSANYIKIFTIKSQEEIETLLAAHNSAPHERKLQKELAKSITTMVHSSADCEKAVKISEILFGQHVTEELWKIDEEALFESGVPQVRVSQSDMAASGNITNLLSAVSKGKILSSKTEARKLIQAGSVRLNKEIYADPSQDVSGIKLIHNKYILVQKGKKSYFLLTVE